ncbi:MAG: TolC family outer membrane protein [Pseudomonadota bacterium]|nr:TolC family outer membrane protein [Pseudomonadota bacterium]
MNKIVIILFLIIFLPKLSFGADLISIYEKAMQNDTIYKQRQLEFKEQKHAVSRARANLFLPKIAISASRKKVGQDISLQSAFGAGGTTNFTTTQYRITLNQSVFDAAKFLNLNQQKKKAKKRQISYLNSQQELIFRVIESYLLILSAENKLNFADSEVQSLQGQLERVNQRFEVGLVAITDLQEARAGFDRANAERLKAKNELDLAIDNIRKITNQRYSNLRKIDIDLPLIAPVPPDVEHWVKNSLKGNLKIAEAQIDELIQKDQLRKSRARYTPKLEIVGSHGSVEQGGRFGSSEVDNTDIGLQLNIPIFHGGDAFFESKKEAANYSVKKIITENQIRITENKTREAFLGVKTQIGLVQAFKQAVKSMQLSLDSIKAGYDVGTRTTVDVVDAESKLSESKRNFYEAIYGYILNVIQLQHQVGSLARNDIEYFNRWLEED